MWPLNEQNTGGGTGARRRDSNTEFHEETYSETDDNFQFELDGRNYSFKPHYYPERVTVDKERDLVREKGICRGEYVNDVGMKNREIHVVGYITTPELKEFHDAIDFGEKAMLISMPWQGEVLIADSKLEGPEGVDVETNHYLYEYTLDLVSTGRDELSLPTNGIIDDGSSDRLHELDQDEQDLFRGR